ncbi:MAG: S26 family signal peptidase, partial [Planctomycetota bacterium]
LVNLLAGRLGSVGRGEVWVFRRAGYEELFIKRVWGLGGESVRLLEGDLFIDGRRLVKERRQLDAVRAPLFTLQDFVRRREAPRGWRQPEPLHTGFRLPDGSVEKGDDPATDVVWRLSVRAPARPWTVVLRLDDGSVPPATVTLGTHKGRIVVGGREVVSSIGESSLGPLRLRTDRWTGIWITNADRLFRVEVDGEEVARVPLDRRGGAPSCEVWWFDAEPRLRDFEVARDLVHAAAGQERVWRVGPDEVFFLGDNSARSRDSRSYGPVPREHLVGRAFAVVWPPKRMRWIR